MAKAPGWGNTKKPRSRVANQPRLPSLGRIGGFGRNWDSLLAALAAETIRQRVIKHELAKTLASRTRLSLIARYLPLIDPPFLNFFQTS